MNVVQSLLQLLKKKNAAETQTVPEGFCPNCWGREEYGGHFYKAVKKENLDINSKDSNVGWVQSYANKHLTGIVLERKGDESNCKSCAYSYKHQDEHTS